MGNRAIIQLKNGNEVSPVLYLHWEGPNIAKILEQTQQIMRGRRGNLPYAFARLVHQAISQNPEGNTGFGVWSQPEEITSNDSQGDAGCFLVDISTEDWTVQQGGGYGLEHPHTFTDVSPLP